MRIGELADLVGLSTRAVRHYHHRGLLPEPERRPNGYREYGLRDVIVLARVRRLTELGLSLAEVRDALADGHGRDLREMLTALDADLVGTRTVHIAGHVARQRTDRGRATGPRERPGHARIGPLAERLAQGVPAGLLPSEVDLEHPFSAAVLDSLSPAQAEVVRRAMRARP